MALFNISSNWKVHALRPNLRPLSADQTGLLCYSNDSIYHIGYDLTNPLLISKFSSSGFLSPIAVKSRLINRIFRLSPNHAITLEDSLFIARRSEIWRCDLKTGKLELDFLIPDNRRALELTKLTHPSGEVDIVFGEYFANPKRKPVRIWGRSNRNSHWTVRSEIPEGEIEHIHSISSIGERIFVLCGDFGNAAGIWISDKKITSLSPVLRGSQSFRATWIKELNGRIFYATDTQIEQNYLYELFIDGEVIKTSKLVPLEGSSIYNGGNLNSRFFSTTVECGLPTGNLIRDIFDNQRGPGILSSEAKIYNLDAHAGFENILSVKKDGVPFRLGQFGSFIFPSGDLPKDTIVAYGNALSDVDDVCLVLKKK